jgi:hypothetical protein
MFACPLFTLCSDNGAASRNINASDLPESEPGKTARANQANAANRAPMLTSRQSTPPMESGMNANGVNRMAQIGA